MVLQAPQYGIELPDRELACAPIESPLGEKYLGAMRAAINCALANRQIITHLVRQGFRGGDPGSRSERSLRRFSQHVQSRRTHRGWRSEARFHPPQGRHSRIRFRSSGHSRSPALHRPASLDRRDHGHGFLHPGRNRRRRAPVFQFVLPRRRTPDESSPGNQALAGPAIDRRACRSRHYHSLTFFTRSGRGGSRSLQRCHCRGGGCGESRTLTTRCAARTLDLHQRLSSKLPDGLLYLLRESRIIFPAEVQRLSESDLNPAWSRKVLTTMEDSLDSAQPNGYDRHTQPGRDEADTGLKRVDLASFGSLAFREEENRPSAAD